MRDAIVLRDKRVLLALVLAAIGAAVGVAVVFPIANSCDDAEKREFVAIAHVDGRQLEPEGHADADSCVAFFETSRSAESVVEHYQDELGSTGWIDLDRRENTATTPRGDEMSSVGLTAMNGPMRFSVFARSYENSEMTHVTVHVSGT